MIRVGGRQGAPHPVDEQQPVREASKRIVDRQVCEARARRLALGDVFDLAHDVERLAAEVAHERHRERDPNHAVVDVHHALLDTVAVNLAREQTVDGIGNGFPVSHVREREERRTEELVFGPPQHPHECPIDAEEPAVDRHQCHADGGVLERATEPLLRVSELDLGALALRDVARVDDEPTDLRVVEKVVADGFHEAVRAVSGEDAELDRLDGHPALVREERVDHPLTVVRMDVLEDVGARE